MKNTVILVLIFFFFSLFDAANAHNIKFNNPQTGVYVVEIDLNNTRYKIMPYISDKLETVKQVAQKTGAIVAINAGFFDPSSKGNISFVLKNGAIIADPSLNQGLMGNIKLKNFIDQILNRSEFRILKNEEDIKLDIANHNDPVEEGWEIMHSIQAGPSLFPSFSLEKEAFLVVKEGKVIRSAASPMIKRARSAIGIKGSKVYLVAVNNDNPMTLKSLAFFMSKLGVEKAMAFDGGSSTSLYVKLPGRKKFSLTCAQNNQARKVKSVLLIK